LSLFVTLSLHFPPLCVVFDELIEFFDTSSIIKTFINLLAGLSRHENGVWPDFFPEIFV